MKKKIALVGGSGFIGHNLAISLKNKGHDVFIVDSLSVNNLYSFKKEEVENKELYKELFAAKQSLWNSLHDVSVKGFEVEVYIQSASEPHYSSGVYSVMNDQWLVSPNKVEFDLDDKKLIKFMPMVFKLINL